MANLSEDLSRRSFINTAVVGTAGSLLTVSRLAEAFETTQGKPLAGSGESSDLTKLSIREAAEMVRRKKVSPVELTKACLARI